MRGPGTACSAALLAVSLGCVSLPTGGGTERSRHHLVVGLFPGIGESHLNSRATNGETLTPGLRVADYTLRPLYIAAVNALSLGFPTLASWLLEPYEGWSSNVGPCGNAVLGFCKAAKRIPAPRDGDPGLTQPNPAADDRRLPRGGGSP